MPSSRRKYRRPAGVVAGLLLLIFLHYSGILVPIESLLVSILAPVQNRVYQLGTGINRIFTGRQLPDNWQVEREMLIAERDALQIETAQLKTALEEFQTAGVERNFLAEQQLTAIQARVVGKTTTPASEVLVIDRGARDGIASGMPVIAGAGAVVGKVGDVNSRTAHVVLLSDSRSSLAAVVHNNEQTSGVVVGDRGLSIKLELVGRDENLAVDQLVVTSGLEVQVPRGLFIGTIEQVTADPNSFFKTAFIQPALAFNELTVVSVVTGHAL